MHYSLMVFELGSSGALDNLNTVLMYPALEVVYFSPSDGMPLCA